MTAHLPLAWRKLYLFYCVQQEKAQRSNRNLLCTNNPFSILVYTVNFLHAIMQKFFDAEFILKLWYFSGIKCILLFQYFI